MDTSFKEIFLHTLILSDVMDFRYSTDYTAFSCLTANSFLLLWHSEIKFDIMYDSYTRVSVWDNANQRYPLILLATSL
jgi:hypothetical protein